MLHINGVGRLRYLSAAIDPTARGTDRITDIPSRILQNTLEQFVLSFVCKMALATFLTQQSMRLIPLLVFLWVVGRVLFVVGYLSEPLRRAYGFAMTMFTSMVAMIMIAYFSITAGLGYDIGAHDSQ